LEHRAENEDAASVDSEALRWHCHLRGVFAYSFWEKEAAGVDTLEKHVISDLDLNAIVSGLVSMDRGALLAVYTRFEHGNEVARDTDLFLGP